MQPWQKQSSRNLAALMGTGAAMRYLSQRFAMPYRPVMGILTDIGTEASKYEFVDLV